MTTLATKKNDDKDAGTELALTAGTSMDLAGDFSSELEGLTGLGYSERQEDGLVPILAILQDNSAEVKRQHSKYIDGAKPGDLIIRSLGLVIDPEETPLAMQICGFQHVWVEWEGEPGDGKPVNQYDFDDRPGEAEEKVLGDDDRKTWVMPSGNRLVDTRYHYAQIRLPNGWMPVVIPMAGTNHTVSRSITQQLKMLRMPNQQKAPSWFRAFSLGTKFNQRGSQSWFNYDPRDIGWITDAEVRADGRRIFESLEAGTIQADISSEAGDVSQDNSGDDAPI